MKNNTKDSKEMLFEMMQKVNPDFKIIKENTHKHMYLISFESESIPPTFETKQIKIGASDDIEALRKALLNLEDSNFLGWGDESGLKDDALHSYRDFIENYGDTVEKIIRTISNTFDIKLNINKIR